MVRIKHRYLLIEILYPSGPSTVSKTPSGTIPDTVLFHAPSPDYLTPGLLARMIRDKLGELYGDYGVGLAGNGLAVKYLSPATSVSILRCPRDAYRLVWSAITYITALPPPPSHKGNKDALPKEEGTPCVCKVVRVSGTIRKAEEEAILRAKRAVLALKEDGGSEDLLGSLLGPGSGGGEGAGIEDSDEDAIEDSDEDAEGAGSSDEDE